MLAGPSGAALGTVVLLTLFTVATIVAWVQVPSAQAPAQRLIPQTGLEQSLRSTQAVISQQRAASLDYLATRQGRYLALFRRDDGVFTARFDVMSKVATAGNELTLLPELASAVRTWESWGDRELTALAARPHRHHGGLPRSRRTFHRSQILRAGTRLYTMAEADEASLARLASQPLTVSRPASAGFPAWKLILVVLLLAGLGLGAFFGYRTVTTLSEEESRRRQAEGMVTALVGWERRYRSVLENLPHALLIVGLDGKISEANQAAATMLSFESPHPLQGIRLASVIPGLKLNATEDGSEKDTALETRDDIRGQFEVSRADGSSFTADVSVSNAQDDSGAMSQYLVLLADASAGDSTIDRLRHEVLHDPLTGLANRICLHDRMALATRLHRRSGTGFALMLLDLDRFKEINDSFGHDLGDQLLKELAGRLTSILRASDTVARIGGDEFGILLPGAGEDSARELARQIRMSISMPFVLKGERFVIDCDVGISAFPRHGSDAESLFRCAEIALYSAKSAQHPVVVYDPAHDNYDPNRLVLLGELYEAVERDQLELYFQPKVRLNTGRVEYVEALLRWNHPERGFIPPGEFIPVAERSEMIRHLTLWVLRAALKQCRLWHDAGLDVCVAVNLSASNLHDPDLCDSIVRLLRECAVSPTWLRLEVTETAVMTDPERAAEILSRLDDMGISLSIDDFGTGYSSLAYLRRLPFSEIKIDRSFVMRMATDQEDAAIVRSVVELGHSLELEVVAEGVEDGQTLEMLRSWECDQAQGFFLSRPVDADGLARWLTEHEHAASGSASSVA